MTPSKLKPFNNVIDEDKTKSVKFDPKVQINYIKNKNNDNYNNIHKHTEFTDPDQISDIDEDIYTDDNDINTDPTDIIEDDEKEILDDDIFEIEEDNTFEHHGLLNDLFNHFLEKYPHLDNYKNKHIIYSMFKMAIQNMPEHTSKPQFYLNFIESSISQLLQSTNNDFHNDE